MMRRLRCLESSRSLLSIALLLLLFPLPLNARSSSGPNTAPTTLSSSSALTPPQTVQSVLSKQQQQQQSPPQHVLIYETEVLCKDDDENNNNDNHVQWKGALPSRWTSAHGEASPPPTLVPCPQVPAAASLENEQEEEEELYATEWDGDWKIVLTASTSDDMRGSSTASASAAATAKNDVDSLGWHYYKRGRTQFRRRTWLRSYTRTTTKRTTTTVSARSATRATATRAPMTSKHMPPTRRAWSRRSASPLRVLCKTLLESKDEYWNFKGLGVSFYKSLLYLHSVGVSLRIPLSSNLDWCDRHPAFPSISSSIGVYLPSQTVACFLSISLNVDYCKWRLMILCAQIKSMCRRLALSLYRWIVVVSLALPLHLLSYYWQTHVDEEDIDDTSTATATGGGRQLRRAEAVQKWWTSMLTKQQPKVPTTTAAAAPLLNVGISERIGMSISWRVSKRRGYEFRVSYWHSYLPTVLYLQSLLSQVRPRAIIPRTARKLKNKRSKQAATSSSSSSSALSSSSFPLLPPNMEYWLRRKTGSLGMSTSGPTPDPPHFSCSACLSLSGFYFGKGRRAAGRPPSASLRTSMLDNEETTTAAATRRTNGRVPATDRAASQSDDDEQDIVEQQLDANSATKVAT